MPSKPPTHKPTFAGVRPARLTRATDEADYDRRWRRYSKQRLNLYPFCVRCEAAGYDVPASVTDHITPHRGSHVLFWDTENHQSLCKTCHDRKTASEDGGFGILNRVTFYPRIRAPSCVVHLIAGPPGSGKSTYVREQMERGDLVIDLDQIVAGLFGINPYAKDREQLEAGLHTRNAMLAGLCHQPKDKQAWVIVSTGGPRRLWWIDALKVKTCGVMRATQAQCFARIDADKDRAPARDVLRLAVMKWFAEEARLTSAETAKDRLLSCARGAGPQGVGRKLEAFARTEIGRAHV